jgi:NDP-sugar pyrophosphorylase family protein
MPLPGLDDFIADLGRLPFLLPAGPCWQVIGQVEDLVKAAADSLGAGFEKPAPGVAVHRSATVAASAELAGPLILGPGCQVGSFAILRGGVWADQQVTIGPHCEVKGSLLFAGSAAAHRNYVGDSIVGQDVNLEAGVVLANRFNERADKQIAAVIAGHAMPTGLEKLGAILGDGCRIGANSVTSPGTLLPPGTVVPRLTFIEPAGQTG